MKFEMIALGTRSRARAGKHVVALSRYQTTLRHAPPSPGNQGSSAR
jgi:hypothetical protein